MNNVCAFSHKHSSATQPIMRPPTHTHSDGNEATSGTYDYPNTQIDTRK